MAVILAISRQKPMLLAVRPIMAPRGKRYLSANSLPLILSGEFVDERFHFMLVEFDLGTGNLVQCAKPVARTILQGEEREEEASWN